MNKYFKYSSEEIKNHIVSKDNWGSYFVVDNFLSEEVFNKLSETYNYWKTEDNTIFTDVEPPRVWRDNEEKGMNLIIGGAGGEINYFDKLFSLSSEWKDFVENIYSNESYQYFHDIFSTTDTYKNYVLQQDIDEGIISCKLSSQLNNYGDIIHPDTTRKVVSYLLYLDTYGWDENSKGGTDFWEVLDKNVDYDKDENSMDNKMRKGRYSQKPHSLKEDESGRIKKFLSINFKPNRLVGFIRTDTSYHSIPPRVLPEGITRDCFQINIWNLKRKLKGMNI